MVLSSMEVDSTNGWFDTLHSDEPEKWMDAIIWVKNSVIGNNKQKANAIYNGVIPRLLQWMIDEDTLIELRTEAAVVLGSIAKGTEENVSTLIDQGCVSVLLKGINNPNLKYIEACLRCLRTIFANKRAPVDQVYQDPTVVPHLINILSRSTCTQECITSLLATCCQETEHQNMIFRSGAIAALAPLLAGNAYKVQMPTLKCLAMLVFENDEVASAVASASYNGDPIPSMLMRLLLRDKTSEMQLAAAKCLAYLYRGGAMEATDPRIVNKTLPTLIRMCSKDRTLEENVEGAEALAYLIETDDDLQRIAAISDHIIRTLGDYLKYTDIQQISRNGKKSNINWSNEMKRAAFKAFAALGANEEDIRKQIIDSDNLMDYIVTGLNCDDYKVAAAAVRCLHSLSRSVQQLRTTFHDHAVWKPLMKLIQEGPDEVLSVASSTLCNLLLEFSPSKEEGPDEVLSVASSILCNLLLEFSPSKECILESGAVAILVGLTGRTDPDLKLNGIWGLMNMTFQVEQRIKSQIIDALGTEQLFRLLSDPDPNILMKTLGLLRNLLSNKLHIDGIMNIYGNQIMQAVVFILEGDHSPQIKEQTLCILANVADGDQAKEYIMSNEDVLKKLMNYMLNINVNLQIAATFCISNLVWNEEEGAYNRQAKLREMGVQKLLQQLLGSSDSVLFERVNTALQQFK